jgi:hypothetical protein|tara:strand:+ start:1314 stop:1928 length:615 start_codon:yes stop_codon:yes gene_type:complete
MKLKFEIGYTVSVIAICFGMLFYNFSKNNNPLEMPGFVEYHFAFNINPSQNSGLINYAVVGVRDGKIISKKPMDVKTFLLQVMGKQQSAANYDNIDLFAEYNLSDCFYKYDSISDDYSECFTLEDLWSLRYSRNPICPSGCIPAPGMKIDGWSQGKFHPSWPQIQILQKYGVIQDSDFFYGENMFKLFQDVEKPDWINKYKTAF